MSYTSLEDISTVTNSENYLYRPFYNHSTRQPYTPQEQPPLCAISYQPPMNPPTYQPSPMRLPSEHGAYIPMTGSNPIRGMVTSVYPNVCSQYGSSLVQVNAMDYYGGTQWCQVGILLNNHHQPNMMYGFEARFMGNSWEFRARDAIMGLYIYIDTIGNGPYGAYRTNDKVSIPGKEGIWTIQIQTQQQPYLLYVPM